jgi:glycolate oxidase iron-sulfur subunit
MVNLSLIAPKDEDLYRCVHCGLCLNVCPTYLETGLETESPRGRIALMKAVREERVGLTDNIVSHMELCLQCRACEVACPSGVPFGRLMEVTRAQIQNQSIGSPIRRILLRMVFRHLLPHPRRLYRLARLLRIYQRTGLHHLISRLPSVLGNFHRQIPNLPTRFFAPLGESFPALGEERACVGLLSGCVMPLAQGPTMEAAVRVLNRNGCRVVVPKSQLCCGALHLHGGDKSQAQELARRNIDAFLEAEITTVVVASAGCGSTMKDYGELLEDDTQYSKLAKRFGDMVVDITEYLAKLPLEQPSSSLFLKVTYQDACHLAHAQRITEAPRVVLRSIPGLELVELENSTRCCGAAGLYSALQPRMSQRLSESKATSILHTGAQVVATANPGCTIQIEASMKRVVKGIRVCHVVDLLDEAYQLDSDPTVSKGP